MICNPGDRRNAAVALAFALVSLPVGVRAADAPPSVDIVASISKYAPSTIRTHVGEKVTLHFTTSDGVHGAKSDDLGIPATTIWPGKTAVITFTPQKAGKFTIYCTMPCGEGHEDMKLTVVVTEA